MPQSEHGTFLMPFSNNRLLACRAFSTLNVASRPVAVRRYLDWYCRRHSVEVFPMAYYNITTMKILVEPDGFEPPCPSREAGLQPAAIGHSATSPILVPSAWNRTCDRPLTRRELYRLSYEGETLVPCEGLEPPRLAALRSKRSVSANSIQQGNVWLMRVGSNHRPSDYRSLALPPELHIRSWSDLWDSNPLRTAWKAAAHLCTKTALLVAEVGIEPTASGL